MYCILYIIYHILLYRASQEIAPKPAKQSKKRQLEQPEAQATTQGTAGQQSVQELPEPSAKRMRQCSPDEDAGVERVLCMCMSDAEWTSAKVGVHLLRGFDLKASKEVHVIVCRDSQYLFTGTMSFGQKHWDQNCQCIEKLQLRAVGWKSLVQASEVEEVRACLEDQRHPPNQRAGSLPARSTQISFQTVVEQQGRSGSSHQPAEAQAVFGFHCGMVRGPSETGRLRTFKVESQSIRWRLHPIWHYLLRHRCLQQHVAENCCLLLRVLWCGLPIYSSISIYVYIYMYLGIFTIYIYIYIFIFTFNFWFCTYIYIF